MTALLTLFVWLIGAVVFFWVVFLAGVWADYADRQRMAQNIRETAETLERLGL